MINASNISAASNDARRIFPSSNALSITYWSFRLVFTDWSAKLIIFSVYALYGIHRPLPFDINQVQNVTVTNLHGHKFPASERHNTQVLQGALFAQIVSQTVSGKGFLLYIAAIALGLSR